MKIKDIKEICWICGRTKQELEKLFEDHPNFKIQLYEVTDMINYSGYYICDICNSMIATVGSTSQDFIDGDKMIMETNNVEKSDIKRADELVSDAMQKVDDAYTILKKYMTDEHLFHEGTDIADDLRGVVITLAGVDTCLLEMSEVKEIIKKCRGRDEYRNEK